MEMITFSHVIAAYVRSFRRYLHGLTHPYRPELNYMRGPGPKWREKNSCKG